jgi:hypothetical protein
MHTIETRLLFKKRTGPGAARLVHVTFNDMAVDDLYKFGVLSADLNDGKAFAVLSSHRMAAVA